MIFFHEGHSGPLFEYLMSQNVRCVSTPFLDTTQDNIRWIIEQLNISPPHIFVPNLVVPAYYASRWIKKAGIKTVGILHSDDPFYHAIIEEFVDGSEKYRLDAVISVSRHLHDLVRNSKNCDRILKKLIGYGVPIPKKVSLRSDKFRIIFLGRLAQRQKRILDVGQALINLTKKNSHIEAIIFGDGPQRRDLHEMLESTEGHAVSMRGSLNNADVPGELMKAHAIVLLSDYEGLPIAILEAMSFGVIPICLRMNSGIDELINSDNGLIVDDRHDDFMSQTSELSISKERWAKMSQNAAIHVKDNFSLEKSNSAYIDFFRSMKTTDPKPIVLKNIGELPRVNPSLRRADRRTKPKPFSLMVKMKIKKWLTNQYA